MKSIKTFSPEERERTLRNPRHRDNRARDRRDWRALARAHMEGYTSELET